jgi:hypothetical protein
VSAALPHKCFQAQPLPYAVALRIRPPSALLFPVFLAFSPPPSTSPPPLPATPNRSVR